MARYDENGNIIISPIIKEPKKRGGKSPRQAGNRIEKIVARAVGGDRVPGSGSIKNTNHNLKGDVEVKGINILFAWMQNRITYHFIDFFGKFCRMRFLILLYKNAFIIIPNNSYKQESFPLQHFLFIRKATIINNNWRQFVLYLRF